MNGTFTSLISRVAFVGSFVLVGLAVWERLLNLVGYSMLRGYAPWRLLEVAAVVVLFVIALQLREIKHVLQVGAPGGKGTS